MASEARKGLEALNLVESTTPDARFVDIQEPGLDGLGPVAELDPETGPVVVFVTAHDCYAIPAFDAHAVDYPLKPFEPECLHRAVERVRTRLVGTRTEDRARMVSA